MPSTTVLQQLQRYCAYQERCHQEVKYKCLELGLRGHEAEEAIAALIADNFLSEERFAIAFAGGKFRMKQWGRRKITMELKQRQVSAYCIQKGLAVIDADDYARTLRKLAEKKFTALKGEHPAKRRYKTVQHLLQRGFEQDLAQETVQELAGEATENDFAD